MTIPPARGLSRRGSLHQSMTGIERVLYAALYQVAGAAVGGGFVAAVREMERVQWLPPEAVRARQEARLAPLLWHAAANVPFYQELYRRLGLAPEALRTLDDLTRLPIITRRAYRDYPLDHFLAANIPPHRRVADRTSGSTGQPLRFYRDRAAMPLALAGRLMFDSWYGLRPFDRSIRLPAVHPAVIPLPVGTPIEYRVRHALTARLKAWYEARTRKRLIAWGLDGGQAEAIYRQMESYHPDYVIGYASTMAFVADELLRRDLRLSRPLRAVVSGAETLTAQRRRLVEQYFDAPIINRFGMRELFPYIAQSCPASPEQFHVNSERVVWETVRPDGSPAAPGERGRVVVTALDNYVMPFIRYETGDQGVAGRPPCPCGRGLPLVESVDGRSQECIHTASGKVISPPVFGAFLFRDRDYADLIRHYQFIQESPNQARLLVVPAPDREGDWQEELRANLAVLLGEHVAVRIELVDEIPPEPSGKRPTIKRR